MRTQNQTIQLPKTKEAELQETISEFFFQAHASSRVEMLNYLLNQFVMSEDFQNTEKIFRSNLIFEVTELSHFIVKLQEKYEAAKHSLTTDN